MQESDRCELLLPRDGVLVEQKTGPCQFEITNDGLICEVVNRCPYNMQLWGCMITVQTIHPDACQLSRLCSSATGS